MSMSHAKQPWARPLGRLPDGTRVSRYWVSFRSTDTMSRDFNYIEGQVSVVAESPAAAVEHVLDIGDWEHPTEAWTHGPRGGRVERFRGWESLVFHRMLNAGDEYKQLRMELSNEHSTD